MPEGSSRINPSAIECAALSHRPFRTLALDGGGMRGLYTATVLDTLARHFATQRNAGPLDVGKGFDLITGTSTGGILAAALAAGVPLAKVIALYCEEGPKIFPNPMPSGLALIPWLFRNRSKAANPNDHLKKTLGEQPGARRFDRGAGNCGHHGSGNRGHFRRHLSRTGGRSHYAGKGESRIPAMAGRNEDRVAFAQCPSLGTCVHGQTAHGSPDRAGTTGSHPASRFRHAVPGANASHVARRHRKLREHRNANRDRLKENLKDNENPSPLRFQKQGSYAMRTTIQHPANDYDIDDGVVFAKADLTGARGAEMTPLDVRKMVCDALKDDRFSQQPEVLKNCVRVYYNEGHHVDVPVYRESGAEGSELCEIASSIWRESDPAEINDWFDGQIVNKKSERDDDDTQFRRMVRLRKRYTGSRDSWNLPTAVQLSA